VRGSLVVICGFFCKDQVFFLHAICMSSSSQHYFPLKYGNWFEPTLFDCVWCEEVKFKSVDEIKLHVLKVHPFNCNSCIKVLETWDKWILHSEFCEESLLHLKYFLTSCALESLTGALVARK